ncbi:MAG TPA: hypothetical protein VGB89_03835 [Bacteroidota bacterium]
MKRSKFIAVLFAAALCVSADVTFAGVGVVVKVRPPAARKEVIIARPHVHSVWIGGQWRWNARTQSHEWVPGKWVNGRRGFVWVGGHWKKTRGGWMYVEGHWGKK